jgi:tellurite resistance protein TerB
MKPAPWEKPVPFSGTPSEAELTRVQRAVSKSVRSSFNLYPERRSTMSFDTFLSRLKSKASELKTEALKYKNKDFLNAAMAGCALVAMADGSVSAEEKQKMIRFIESNDALSVFTTSDVIKAFQEFVGQLEFDKDIGEAKAYQSLLKMKSNEGAARLLVRMVIAVAASDGNFDAKEQDVASKIIRELGLSPSEFELK